LREPSPNNFIDPSVKKCYIIKPMQVGLGFSSRQDYIKAAKEAANNAMASLDSDKADLALVFTTKEFNHSLVLKEISAALANTSLLGLSSSDLICSQGVLSNGIIIACFSFPEEIYFNTTCVEGITERNALSLGEKLGEELLYGCKGNRRNLSLIFSNCRSTEGQNIFLGLQRKVGKSFPMVGASVETEIYSGSAALNNAACGVLFGGKLTFGMGTKHGWKPLGKPRKVTLSSGNAVIEIDGKPAASLYKEYFDKDAAGIKKDLSRISAYYPIGINISGQKEYLLRSLYSIEENGALVFNGDVPKGSDVRLMISSKEACLESGRQAAELARDSLKGQKIKFVLIFNSSARSALLGREASKEIEAVKDACGWDIPVAGVYTCAEQAPLNSANYLGRPYFYNNSITVLTIAG